jgi:L-2-hydroxyglutarate oxidase
MGPVTARRAVVVGGGIVGLAVAHELAARRGYDVTVLEKESRWAAHQTGHNSGVVHAGLYYRPGSLKATLSVAGNASVVRFAEEHGVAVRVCGKLVVATDQEEMPRLRALAERAGANGVPVRLLTPAEARGYEPEVACVAALHVASTGVIDFAGVCAALRDRLAEHGADLRTDAEVKAIRAERGRVAVASTAGVFRAGVLVNCAGLHSDLVARMAGLRPSARILPFRGEYHELRPAARHLVRGLIYPVPDPRFPFLGVHLTRGIDGEVHAGPNAVLGLSREGYRWRDVSAGDLAEMLAYPGLWRLAHRHLRTGAAEVARSLSRRRFAAAVARLVPAITPDDLVPAGSGVRAQAVTRQGTLVDDFLVETAPHQVHVLNAPSPAATSCLEIATHVADQAEAAAG